MVPRFILGTNRSIQQLEVLFPSEERVLRCHPETSDYMILNQASERLARGRNQVLVVGVRDEHGLRPSNLIFCSHRISRHRQNVAGKAYEGNVCSSL